jgi:hypothetical protein
VNSWLSKALLLPLAWLAFSLAWAGAAGAEEALLLQAAKAWDAAELNRASDLYEKALQEGGLYPSDVLVAYTRVGTVQAAMGKANAALSAFRVAAALDPAFELPSEAGPKARNLYKQARADAMKQGGKLDVSVEVPNSSAPDTEFIVTAHVSEAFAPLIQDIGISVRDPSVGSMKAWTTKKPASTAVSFEVPAKAVIAGANLLVRVDALDSRGNRWASTEKRVKVDQNAATATSMRSGRTIRGGGDKHKESEDGGFWSTPWPWVIGGAIVAGGVATYFLTRPTNDVTIQAPQWAP